MMEYENPRAKAAEKESKPHHDLSENVAFFHRVMPKVVVLNPKFRWELQDRKWDSIYNPQTNKNETVEVIKEYKACLFSWQRGDHIMWTALSFHQEGRQFRITLSQFLNKMGEMGHITKKGLEQAKKFDESERQMKALFGV